MSSKKKIDELVDKAKLTDIVEFQEMKKHLLGTRRISMKVQ
jgi:hypothetical protein